MENLDKQYFCRTCHGLRNHKVLFKKEVRNKDDDEYFQSLEEYLLIECMGCETISFLNIYGNTEMVRDDDNGAPEYYFNEHIYPTFLPKGEEINSISYLPKNISDIYVETISCLKSKSFVLAAGGFRAIIEAICNNLKIKKSILSTRIDMLFQKGILTEKESRRLHSIRFVGNDALHEITTPKPEQLYIVLEIVNHLLENLFIQDKKMKDNLDSIIDEYEDFYLLLKNKMKKELVGEELTLSKILGKAIRLFKNKQILLHFESQLKIQIKRGEVDFISIAKEGKETIYKIEREVGFVINI